MCRVIVTWSEVYIGIDNESFDDEWFFDMNLRLNDNTFNQKFYHNERRSVPRFVPNPNPLPLADIVFNDKPRLVFSFVGNVREIDPGYDDRAVTGIALVQDCVTTPNPQKIFLHATDSSDGIHVIFILLIQIIDEEVIIT